MCVSVCLLVCLLPVHCLTTSRFDKKTDRLYPMLTKNKSWDRLVRVKGGAPAGVKSG